MGRVLGVEEQVGLVLGEFPGVVWELCRLLNDEFYCLRGLMLERARGEGFELYGDASFRKGVDALRVDVLEELADALWYLACKRIRERGGVV